MVKTKNIKKNPVLKKHKKKQTQKNENKTKNNKNIIRIYIGHHTRRKNNNKTNEKNSIKTNVNILSVRSYSLYNNEYST